VIQIFSDANFLMQLIQVDEE